LPRAFSPRNDESLPPSRIWEADVVIHLFDPLVPGFSRDDALGRKFKLKTLTDASGTVDCPQIHQVLFLSKTSLTTLTYNKKKSKNYYFSPNDFNKILEK
jgi:hypothetical protein